MKKIKIVFMGTPEFACGVLESLLNSNYEVIAVVTQPDKKVGRKQVLTASPVKKMALENNIKVFQPVKIREDYQDIIDLNPDLIVTCAYGQLIGEKLLNSPTYGSINVHASLLPKLRGGAPIHKAIINGDTEAGISIMRMVKKMDAGDYMLQKKIDIDINDTAGSLHDKLVKISKSAIIEAIDLLINNKAVFIKQDDSKATFAYNISKEEEKIDFNKGKMDVYNQIRGLIPWPVSNMEFNGNIYKIHGVKLCDFNYDYPVGSLFYNKNRLFLACKDGCLEITKIQKAGKKCMDAKSFILGNKDDLIEV